MEKFINALFFQNISKKLLAIGAAVVIWLIVNNSITETKVFPRVSVHIINIPVGKTMEGLQMNGLLDRRIAVTVTGNKQLLDRLSSKDLEIVVDASDRSDEWIVRPHKHILVSVNPDIPLTGGIDTVTFDEFICKLSKFVTLKIPVYILPPRGEPPEGYQFLDIYPHTIDQTVSGPEDVVKKLQDHGVELTFDLSDISKEELDSIKSDTTNGAGEVNFTVPDSWKKIAIPFIRGGKQELNGREAKYLTIQFLRKELMPLDRELPVLVFYPAQTAALVNPKTSPLQAAPWLVDKNGVFLINQPLFVKEVSRAFLDTVRDSICLIIIADAKREGKPLRWEVQFLNAHVLEEKYITQLLAISDEGKSSATALKKQEMYLRKRFREYMKAFQLWQNKDTLFAFQAIQEPNAIVVIE